MLKVSVGRDKAGRTQSISVKGHAGYAEAGEDIVCAAVTAIMTTTITGMTDILDLEPESIVEEGHISLTLEYPEDEALAGQAQLLLETCALGLRQLELSYQDYIVIKVD